jgi:hypothetical protein
MGSLDDVAQMKTKLYDAKCSTTPCVQVDGIGCTGMINKVYSIGVFLCAALPPQIRFLAAILSICICIMKVSNRVPNSSMFDQNLLLIEAFK